ncbi:MAG: hypothetical protein ABIH21_01215 [Patescibacteria group bacterium]
MAKTSTEVPYIVRRAVERTSVQGVTFVPPDSIQRSEVRSMRKELRRGFNGKADVTLEEPTYIQQLCHGKRDDDRTARAWGRWIATALVVAKEELEDGKVENPPVTIRFPNKNFQLSKTDQGIQIQKI